MQVIALRKAPVSLLSVVKGRMLEIHPQVFIGALPRNALEDIWCLILKQSANKPHFGAVLAEPHRGVQGFKLRICGCSNCLFSVVDGITLSLKPSP